MTQLTRPHPFLRGVDPSEPFDIAAYSFEIGKANCRFQEDRRTEAEAVARYAEAVLTAFYSGKPIPPRPEGLPAIHALGNKPFEEGATEYVFQVLDKHGPMTASQLLQHLGYCDVLPLLHQLHRHKRILREGRKGSREVIWKVPA